MVTESIKRILSEKMHVVDKKMFPLAEYIYDTIDSQIKQQNYNATLTIPIDITKKYYPYNNLYELKIIIGFDNSIGTMEYKIIV